MVHKIKFTIFFLIVFVLLILSFVLKNNIETNLLKTLLPKSVIKSGEIVAVANKSSSVIKVIFESKNENALNEAIDKFNNEIDKDYFESNKPDISDTVKKYLSHPSNFLSYNSKTLLKEKRYDEIFNRSLEALYNPADIQIADFDKDPYFLFDDFLLSNKKISGKINYFDDKYYEALELKIKSDEGLSPDLVNKNVKEIILLSKKISSNDVNIYLAGTPIHSYYASRNSVISINIICILSVIFIIFLTYFCFKSLKPLLPVLISISFGMLLGFCATKLWFRDFQIITMVFSTTLIGIGIDYSYHYFFKSDNKKFIKNLSFGFLTSIIPFILLYLTQIDLLKQVAIFSVFGLFGIYLVILFIYPLFDIKQIDIDIQLHKNFYKISFVIILILCVLGIFRLHFNDTLSALYVPSNKLLKAETLYNKISNDNYTNAQIIINKGDNLEALAQNEEKLTNELNKDNIDYISFSKFFPSQKTQKENFILIKELYNSNLDNYKNILSSNQIKKLKNMAFSPVDFSDSPILKEFLLDDNTSLVFAFTKQKINLEDSKILNLKSDIEQYMKKYRHLLLLLFPCVILLLIIVLSFIYGFKKAFKIVLPSLFAVISAILIASLITSELNLFSIISLFLIIGFTIDYSIFRADKESEKPVFLSALTTSFSFLLLCFCNFKLLSSMSLILLIGIITAYISGYLIFNRE